nr:hypothetical protein [Tanacetum cinerariifolium]
MFSKTSLLYSLNAGNTNDSLALSQNSREDGGVGGDGDDDSGGSGGLDFFGKVGGRKKKKRWEVKISTMMRCEVDCKMVVKEIEDGLLEEMEKFEWWFEQDIGGESEDDKEKRLVVVKEGEWMS